MVSTEYSHIVRTEGTQAGEPWISGHRIRVRDVVMARDLGGFAPEEIAANVYPSLTLGQVYAALGYYKDHRAELDQIWAADAQMVDDFLRQYPHIARDQRLRG